MLHHCCQATIVEAEAQAKWCTLPFKAIVSGE
ncbi:hypothetical protein COLO4_08303 [Corchorus olitorius]|uniref:Uncharacterized protein n=1 Tax=Corchorus olitorius TaxID=93759 RepID=A0A1R3KGG4_9ROSI|nr:hypothetical protein COLO4_08303 [Corchorus olitorius]